MREGGTSDVPVEEVADPPGMRTHWSAALQDVAQRHRNAARAARFAGDEDAAARHLRAAMRAEEVVADLRLLPVTRAEWFSPEPHEQPIDE